MRKLWYIALTDLRITFAERGMWVNLVIIPCTLIFIIGLVTGGFGGDGTSRVRVDVLDNDQSAFSAQLLDDLREVDSRLILCPMDNDAEDICGLDEAVLTEDRITERLENNTASAALIIPTGFNDRVFSGDPVNIVYRSDEQPGQPSTILQSVQAAVQRVSGATVAARVAMDVYENAGLPATFANDADREQFQQAVYDRASNIWSLLPETIHYAQSLQQSNQSGPTSGFQQSVPGIGSMYVMFTVLSGAFILLRERKDWTLQRLITMPVSAGQVIGGKMLARFVMGMIQFGVAFAFGGLVLRADFGNNLLALVLVMAAFTLCISAITLLLATIATSENQVNGLVTLMAVTLAPLGGAWWPLEIVPEWMQTIGHVSPVAWAMDGFSTLIYRGGGIQDVLLPVSVLVAAGVAIFLIAARRFRYD